MRVVILARWPEPGKCKTRLIPAIGPAAAARLHRTLAEHTVSVARQSRLQFELWGTGADEQAFHDWLGPLKFAPQPAGDLGDKLRAASEPHPVIFLGTDAPDLTPDLLQSAAYALEQHPAVIGPAEDGGYWTLGLRRPVDGVFTDIPWGTGTVYKTTLSAFEAAGTIPHVLPTLADLDRPEDLYRWPHLLA
ncbi:MAG: TIGR04282 family arsenosugar biosynthesis glycosyltransferase [Pseudomonadota bacterium]